MARLRPDPTFYASPTLAGEAPPEELAYVALLATGGTASATRSASWTRTPPARPTAAWWAARLPARRERAAPLRLERLQLAPVPLRAERRTSSGATSSCPGRTARASTSSIPSPIRGSPQLVKVIEGEEVMAKTGYAAPHTVHCGPDGIYLNALGAPDGDGPGGIFMLDHETFEVKGRVGAGPRPAVPGLRLLLAPGPGHDDHQRVGHAQHGEGRRESRAAAGRQVRPRAARVGPAASAPT